MGLWGGFTARAACLQFVDTCLRIQIVAISSFLVFTLYKLRRRPLLGNRYTHLSALNGFPSRRQITRTFAHQLRQSWCRNKNYAPGSTYQASMLPTDPQRIIAQKISSKTILDKSQQCMHQSFVNWFTLTHSGTTVHHSMSHGKPKARNFKQLSIIPMTAGFQEHPNSHLIFSFKTMEFSPRIDRKQKTDNY